MPMGIDILLWLMSELSQGQSQHHVTIFGLD